MAPPVCEMTSVEATSSRPLPQKLLIANAQLGDDSDLECPVTRDGARSHRKVEKLQISSKLVARDGFHPCRPLDSDIGLSQACREVCSRVLGGITTGTCGVVSRKNVAEWDCSDWDIARACHFCTRVRRLQRPLDGIASLAQVGDSIPLIPISL